ncbi:MAG TPA: hypothetical protein VGM44_19145 [Polyangiaceae bacterium]|jgi:hypothetical protein
MRAFLALAFALTLSACPTNNHEKGSSLPPCSKFGDNCEFSPGKLGSCVVKDGCTEGNCFVCQSQH